MDELKHAKQIALVSWPSPQDYNEAVQNPQHSFADTSLGLSVAETDSFGLPRPNTGMFASVYKLHCHDGVWALRCFLHFVADQAERYAAIGKALKQDRLASMLDFDLQERGVRVRGQWFPVLKMQWCEGETLDCWLASRLYERGVLEKFLAEWKNVLAELAAAGIAHGDLQHGNVLISGGQVKLVDYDGMFVPGLCGKISNELGHRDYQHPKRTQKHFGPELDHFSSWVIYFSVHILSLDPGVWDMLNGGDDCLIFRQRDFNQPLHSAAFHLLENHSNPDIRQDAKTLRSFLSLAPEQVPPLSRMPVDLADLPELLEPSEHPHRADENREEKLPDENEDIDEDSSMGAPYHGRKRQRSRMKGGSTGQRRVPSAPAEAQAPEEPFILSPLAQLVRRVSGQALPGQQPAAAVAQPAANSANLSTSGTFTQVSDNLPVTISAKLSWFLLAIGILGFSLFVLFAFVIDPSHMPLSPLLAKGDRLFQQEKFEEAATEYQNAIDFYRKSAVLGPVAQADKSTSMLEALSTQRLGDAHFAERRFQEALSDYSQASELYRKMGADSSSYARSLGREGRAYEALDRIEDAYTAYNQAVAMYERLGVHPALDKDMSEYMADLTRVSLAAGHYY